MNEHIQFKGLVDLIENIYNEGCLSCHDERAIEKAFEDLEITSYIIAIPEEVKE